MLIVDYFAGGGGASTGIAQALGRAPDVAVDHWATALDTHAANHPTTLHMRDDVWRVRPRRDIPGGPVGIMWASPSCTHHSRAKSKAGPLSEQLRAQPWVVTRFASQRRPYVIFMENVAEFVEWGPLDAEHRPIRERRGETFRRFVARLEALGYSVAWRVLNAADYGAPTSRRRVYLVARCDGLPVAWPAPTHGPGRAHPHRAAAECIDWSIPCPSIFDRPRPLAEATQRRVADGIRRYVLGEREPFVFDGRLAGIVQTGYGERPTQTPRALDIRAPLGTVVAGGAKHALFWIVKHFGGVVGHGVDRPLGTITVRDHHGLVAAHLEQYNGTGTGQDVRAPLGTVTTRDRFALVQTFIRRHLGECVAPVVTVRGERYAIVDIGMRMLAPRELARAMGFADSYELLGTKTDQIAQLGNAVVPQVARALVAANAPSGMRVAS